MTPRQRLLFGLLLAAHLATDALPLLLVRVTEEYLLHLPVVWLLEIVFVPAYLGFVPGQTVLLGVWLALPALSLQRRIVGAGFACALLWLTFLAAARVAEPHVFELTPMLMFGVELALGAIVAGSALQYVGHWFGWRIEFPEPAEGQLRETFQLRQLLAVMAGVCGVLGAARALIPAADARIDGLPADVGVWFVIAQLIAVALMLLNLIGVCVYLHLHFNAEIPWTPPRNWAVCAGLPWLYAAVTAGVGSFPFIPFAGFGVLFVFLWLLVVIAAQYMTIGGTLAALRAIGFDMDSSRYRQRKLPEEALPRKDS